MTAPQEPLTLTLGQRVRFKDLIFRAAESRPHPALSTRTERYKVWRRHATTYGGAKSGEGIVVGTRTLTDGHSPYVDDEVGFTYRPKKSHRAVVIATALRRKPVLAFLEDVEPVARDDAAELRAALEDATVAIGGVLASPAYIISGPARNELHEAITRARDALAAAEDEIEAEALEYANQGETLELEPPTIDVDEPETRADDAGEEQAEGLDFGAGPGF